MHFSLGVLAFFAACSATPGIPNDAGPAGPPTLTLCVGPPRTEGGCYLLRPGDSPWVVYANGPDVGSDGNLWAQVMLSPRGDLTIVARMQVIEPPGTTPLLSLDGNTLDAEGQARYPIEVCQFIGDSPRTVRINAQVYKGDVVVAQTSGSVTFTCGTPPSSDCLAVCGG